MLWPGTLIGAGAGFAIASIPGALLGALLGQALDRRLQLQNWAQLRERLGGRAALRNDELLFVLLGRLSPLDGLGARDIGLSALIERATDGQVREVILATNFNAEGEATAHVLGEQLKARGLKVTRLARGVPVGSELEYVDLGTIAHAFMDRR